jgi:hypothetical protein
MSSQLRKLLIRRRDSLMRPRLRKLPMRRRDSLTRLLQSLSPVLLKNIPLTKNILDISVTMLAIAMAQGLALDGAGAKELLDLLLRPILTLPKRSLLCLPRGVNVKMIVGDSTRTAGLKQDSRLQ